MSIARVCEGCGRPVHAGLESWHSLCSSCGLETADLLPHIRDRSGPDIDEDAREQALRTIRDTNFEVLLAWLRDIGRTGRSNAHRPKLLDVGCAHGWFLEKAAADFDVLGIEPDEEVARRTLLRGIPVRGGFFPDALTAGEAFDVIVFNDVLEHIPDVVQALKRCEERLTAGGIVVVNAPDRRGVFYGLARILHRVGMKSSFDRLWQKGLPSPHLYYFQSRSLAAVAKKAGMSIVAERHLPTLTMRGLYSRIRCSGDVPKWKALLLTAGILPMVPVLSVLPADITVWVLARAPEATITEGA